MGDENGGPFVIRVQRMIERFFRPLFVGNLAFFYARGRWRLDNKCRKTCNKIQETFLSLIDGNEVHDVKLSDEEIMSLTKLDGQRQTRLNKAVEQVLEQLKANPHNHKKPELFDADPFLLNTPECIINIKRWTYSEHNKNLLCRMMTRVKFPINAPNDIPPNANQFYSIMQRCFSSWSKAFESFQAIIASVFFRGEKKYRLIRLVRQPHK
jgi:hypothetical protein